MHGGGGGAETGMTAGDEEVGRGNEGGSAIPLGVENPQPEEHTPEPSRRRKRAHGSGSGRKLTLSSQIGRRVHRHGNVELIADVGAEGLSGAEDEVGSEDARPPG